MDAKTMIGGKGLDTPYVVKFHNTFQPSEDKRLFEFVHPNPSSPELIDNTR
jgi:hypothetical protein